MKKELAPHLETELGMTFVKPDRELLQQLREKLSIIAASIGKDPLDTPTPQKGFLAKPLTDEQKRRIDQVLGPGAAQEGVALQDKLGVVPVKECGERMVSIPRLFTREHIPLSVSKKPFNAACGKWANKPRVYWTRESVAQRLLLAGQSLQQIGIMMHLEDAFRPLGVQEGLFLRRVKLILQEHPEWLNDWESVWTEARSKTAVAPWMAGHKSGAAVDITLQTMQGAPLPLGNNYPDGGPRVALHFPYLTQDEWNTRMLFAQTMELSGLRIYPFENWHASFGDLSAGITFGENVSVTPDYATQYGPIRGFNPSTGEIEPYDESEYFEPFYNKGELFRELQGNR